ncbi:4-(cytidine 5'-diphospho)-2-C-methyl-D-erythritol kinase [Gephyromycinifex aptenodytis]|uniref:4-(cytidine 5'-diphospho)-2-C-methyl-D-erythritol kinase n=1 Tax=Gephyromycinifex aptenodytis TaxID=2716227 RepID=UPI0014459581|nr:4-(cytidine 5'-diphospho)-2-C-methyl-D-erythritol kinase [Gephyromycinifex aptenodytis]
MTSSVGDPGVRVRVPAKINLELKVGPRREDGYHELATVFHAVDLFDDITVTPAEEWGVAVIGPYADLVPADSENLALAAAQLLAESVGQEAEVGPVHIRIDKSIPVAGGMAGGSADAAGALVACDSLWGLRSGPGLLHECAASLGSDVNFALAGGTALGSGRGEKVVPALSRGNYHWVLAVSDEGLSTPSVFAELDRLRADQDVPQPQPSSAMMAALRSGDPSALAGALDNDLQQAAISLRPDLGEVIDAGIECGALAGIVSGSGPTIVFLVKDHDAGLDLSVGLAANRVVAQVHRAAGPVPGAHVLTTANEIGNAR